ncbi:fluoride efflux transporter CrcB [Paenibacillus sp. HB172176]|uniref:fluoride efflux transporter CrcB n=1 Tax=Paenibacillus sp. HB172176 TaxID=2493690 RepID=UPI00143BDB7A|nr:fluoride efflux transporter CrcB [Paenibacillus sp. HB172176]
MNVIAVGIGGFAGAILRYELGERIGVRGHFPAGTLIINLLGCLFLAWFFTVIVKRTTFHPNVVLMLGTGFTGAFTTFSTFSVETTTLLRDGNTAQALLYVLVSLLGGIGLALLGAKLGMRMNAQHPVHGRTQSAEGGER